MTSLKSELDFSTDLCIGYFIDDDTRKDNCIEFYLTKKRFDFRKKLNYIRVLQKEYDIVEEEPSYLIDQNDVFLNHFCTEGISCDNWMVLRPNGDYRIYYAEGGSYIFDELKKEWNSAFQKAEYKKLKKLSKNKVAVYRN